MKRIEPKKGSLDLQLNAITSKGKSISERSKIDQADQ